MAAAAVGVTRLVQVGVDVASSRWGAEVAEPHPGVLATVALHPNEAPRLGGPLDEALREIERAGRARAGTRRSARPGWTTSAPARTGGRRRSDSFRAHIAIAKGTARP